MSTAFEILEAVCISLTDAVGGLARAAGHPDVAGSQLGNAITWNRDDLARIVRKVRAHAEHARTLDVG